MNPLKAIARVGKNIVQNFKEIYAEKQTKFINKGIQDHAKDQRDAALKNLFDPKAKLSGAMKRRLLEQTGRPLDPSEGYTLTAPSDAGAKWFRRMMKLPMRSLHRWSIRAAHRVSGLQCKFDKATTQRAKRLLQPDLDRSKMVNKVVSEVKLFRVANVKPMPVRKSRQLATA